MAESPVRICCLGLLVLLLFGCAGQGGPTAQTAGTDGGLRAVNVRQLPHAVSVQSMPAAVNWDNQPGADGVVIRLYFFREDRPKAIALVHGTVECAIYEGVLKDASRPTVQPFYEWSITAEQLQSVAGESVFGTGYEVQLAWGARVPTRGSMTLLVTYRAADGSLIRSRPTVILVS